MCDGVWVHWRLLLLEREISLLFSSKFSVTDQQLSIMTAVRVVGTRPRLVNTQRSQDLAY